MKFSVFTNKISDWEYRCSNCRQLRFIPDQMPEQCGNCKSVNITVGRPGDLPELGQEAPDVSI